MRKFADSALVKGFEREHCNDHTHSLTGVVGIWSKQSLMPQQLYPELRISIWAWSATRVTTFAKDCAFTGIGTPLELEPFSETA